MVRIRQAMDRLRAAVQRHIGMDLRHQAVVPDEASVVGFKPGVVTEG